MLPTSVTAHFRVLLGHAGVRRTRFHDLRHTCATLLLEQGVELVVIKDLLGHAHISITAEIYTRPPPPPTRRHRIRRQRPRRSHRPRPRRRRTPNLWDHRPLTVPSALPPDRPTHHSGPTGKIRWGHWHEAERRVCAIRMLRLNFNC
ncbi:tyrosine-type recombinase/integrase [Streptacidiphilus monticola]